MTNICVNFNCNFLLIKRVEKKKKLVLEEQLMLQSVCPITNAFFLHLQNKKLLLCTY